LIGALAAAASGAVAPVARSQGLRIDITRGRVEPMPIAVSPFSSDSPQAEQVGREIKQVIAANLERCGLFRPLDERAFIQTPQALRNALPRFADWRAINAQALVQGNATIESDGRAYITLRLWDVFGESEMYNQGYRTSIANARRIAHKASDAIYKRVTGEDGYFDTQIVYIAESGPAQQRVKRLAIMDQDGANHQVLNMPGITLALTPRFSPNVREITYLAYVNNKPRVYVYNLDMGRQELLGDFPGMTFAPRFSPEGNRVVMSLSEDGNSNIYNMDLRTRRTQRLTNHPSINTSPSYSPDGRMVVFNSDRGGTQQLYVMDADGTNPRRITFGKGRYGTPVWSPRGDLIAFTRIDEGKFYIGVMRPDGQGERLLTEGFLVEGPTWAPNGRVLMYFRQNPSDLRGQGGAPRLFSIDLTGFNEREIMTPFDASDPAWSPLLP
jgi:TolB protein